MIRKCVSFLVVLVAASGCANRTAGDFAPGASVRPATHELDARHDAGSA